MGTVTVNIEGRDVTFRFSMLALQIFAETMGTDLSGLAAAFENVKGDLRVAGTLLYAGARAHCEIEGLPCDFRPGHGVEWVGMMEQSELEKVFAAFAESKYLKNAMGAATSGKERTPKA